MIKVRVISRDTFQDDIAHGTSGQCIVSCTKWYLLNFPCIVLSNILMGNYATFYLIL